MGDEKVKSNFFKRLGAFIIDYFIVVFLLSLITMGFETDSNLVNDANDLVNSYVNNEITIEEYNNQVVEINYKLQKSNVWINAISCSLYVGYFVVFACLNKGQTLGKKIFKLRVVSKNDKSANVGKMFIRSLFIYGILSSLYATVFVNFLNAKVFNIGSSIISYIEYSFIIVSFFMVLYRKDKRGLHDIVAGTNVIGEVR